MGWITDYASFVWHFFSDDSGDWFTNNGELTTQTPIRFIKLADLSFGVYFSSFLFCFVRVLTTHGEIQIETRSYRTVLASKKWITFECGSFSVCLFVCLCVCLCFQVIAFIALFFFVYRSIHSTRFFYSAYLHDNELRVFDFLLLPPVNWRFPNWFVLRTP